MTMSSTRDPDMFCTYRHEQPGVYVTVYRDGLTAPDRTGTSERHHLLTVNGLVTTGAHPALRPLPQAAQMYLPSPEAPAVWLVREARRTIIVPASIPVDGVPDLTGWIFGGNFAYRADEQYHALVGFDAAVQIHDHRES